MHTRNPSTRKSSDTMGFLGVCGPAREDFQRVAVHQAHSGHREARADRQDSPRLAAGRVSDDNPVEWPQHFQCQRQAPAEAAHSPCDATMERECRGLPALSRPQEGACLLRADLQEHTVGAETTMTVSAVSCALASAGLRGVGRDTSARCRHRCGSGLTSWLLSPALPQRSPGRRAPAKTRASS